jgi:hypothetical protein
MAIPNTITTDGAATAAPLMIEQQGSFAVGGTVLTDRKFNRMRPSMARVLGLETRSAKEG